MAINLAFFGLSREPFNPAPDPSFLFLSPGHEDALGLLVYGVTERKAFMLLTGEIGTGKTTLLQALMAQLSNHTAVAFVTQSTLPFEGIVECILDGFGIAKPGQSTAQQLLALQAFLMDRYHAGQNAVVILDEAQNLTLETLEQIRLLSNLETRAAKILQIVLVGQPELATKVERPELRQLDQRIALRCRTVPLTASETRDYIQTRLRVAGATTPGMFSDEAVERIARETRGIPRLINNVCDYCLVIGYADQRRRIDRKIADEAIRYFRKPSGWSRRLRRLARRRAFVWMSGAGVAAATGLVAVHLDVGRVLGSYSAHLVGLARSMRDLVMR
jgi:general secretion pathway protein A